MHRAGRRELIRRRPRCTVWTTDNGDLVVIGVSWISSSRSKSPSISAASPEVTVPSTSSNPAFKNMEKVIKAQETAAPSAEYLDQMYQQPARNAPARERFLTVDDVVTKTAVILTLAVVSAFATAWFELYYLALPAALVGFVLSMIVIFKRKISPPLIIAYALAEGIFLGAITG